MEEEIQELDSQLVEVIASVSLMQDQISDTEKQIVKAQEDYDVAKAQEDAQYLAMKKRLRYLYEKGDTSYIEILSNASNWSGMLNQANYVEKLYEYDKQMLQDRLDYELDTISSMGFVDYFLIVWDFIKYARDHDIMVGPGRGSAAGSLVAYTLGITQLDPIRYDLLFERFLNPERVTICLLYTSPSPRDRG